MYGKEKLEIVDCVENEEQNTLMEEAKILSAYTRNPFMISGMLT